MKNKITKSVLELNSNSSRTAIFVYKKIIPSNFFKRGLSVFLTAYYYKENSYLKKSD